MRPTLVFAAILSVFASHGVAMETVPANRSAEQRAALGPMPSDPEAQLSWKLHSIQIEINDARWLIAMGEQGLARADNGATQPGMSSITNSWRGAGEMWGATQAGGRLRLNAAHSVQEALLKIGALRAEHASVTRLDRATVELTAAEEALARAKATSESLSKSAAERRRQLAGSP
jgi:hypothetical protein